MKTTHLSSGAHHRLVFHRNNIELQKTLLQPFVSHPSGLKNFEIEGSISPELADWATTEIVTGKPMAHEV